MRFKLLYVLAMLAGTAQPSIAEEDFGKFTTELVGRFVFQEQDGKALFQLDNPFEFIDPNGLHWDVPKNDTSDGASIPDVFWPVIGHPFEGLYLPAAIVHDHYCRTKERIDADTHRNFYYGMRAAGVEDWKATLMYWAVSTFGPHWTLEQKVRTKQDCHTDPNNTLVCNLVQTVETVPVVSASIDLSDPTVFAFAQSKFTEVARTLKTTNGAKLDVATSGIIDARSLSSVEANAATYRSIFLAGTFKTDPSSLGLLSDVQAISLDDLQVWPQNQLPPLDSTFKFDFSHAETDAHILGNLNSLGDRLNREFVLNQTAVEAQH